MGILRGRGERWEGRSRRGSGREWSEDGGERGRGRESDASPHVVIHSGRGVEVRMGERGRGLAGGRCERMSYHVAFGRETCGKREGRGSTALNKMGYIKTARKYSMWRLPEDVHEGWRGEWVWEEVKLREVGGRQHAEKGRRHKGRRREGSVRGREVR